MHRHEGSQNSGDRPVGERIEHDDPFLLQRFPMRPLAGRAVHRTAPQEQRRAGKCRKGEAHGGKERRRSFDSARVRSWLDGKEHFGLGSAKIDVIPGFSPNGNGSNQVHSFDGVENYVSQAKQKGNSFCVIIAATHAHHPWDHGKESNFPAGNIRVRPHYLDTPTARQAMAKHAAEVEVLDRQVRETRELMKRMDLEKDTILIFLSDRALPCPEANGLPTSTDRGSLPCLWKDDPARKDRPSHVLHIVPTWSIS